MSSFVAMSSFVIADYMADVAHNFQLYHESALMRLLID